MDFVIQSLLAITLICVIWVSLKLRFGTKSGRVFVVLLGDIGRSPRMQFHSLSLANAGFDVFVFGYKGSQPYPEVSSNVSIHLKYLMPFPSSASQKLPRLLVFALKVVWQAVSLFITLLACSRPSHILLQNPPSLPTVAVCWFVCVIRGCHLVIDWHNYGYTILALELGSDHPLVRIHRWYEHVFGRLSSYNICVTNAMREDLLASWNIRAVTMHDRPPTMFTDIDIIQRHQLFQKLDIFRMDDELSLGDGQELTLMTRKDACDGRVRYRDDRPALVVSSTSWTEDEDFSLLLKALDVYDTSATVNTELPSLLCVITGKGPLKEHYLHQIQSRSWTHVCVHTPWLDAADYPKLLACADLGVCLHTSSSGLDLPMKVVDMFGCRLPVCAVNFHCLNELVEHDKNGLVFDSDTQLADQLQQLLHGFPDHCDRLRRYREHLKTFQQLRWDDVWTTVVRPIFV
jgi:beta-1,4-mannosyltransferase